jgi:tryptophan synthase alpha subunit
MILHNAIEKANAKGNLGLILYVIPNFPNPKTFQSALTILEQSEAVSILESTYPTTQGYSEHANDTIRRAHLKACEYQSPDLRIRTRKPTLLVLYRGTLQFSSFESFLRDRQGDFDGLILEWSEPDEQTYVDASNRQGVELVQCVGPWMNDREMDAILSRCIDRPLIYLMSAPRTGAELFTNEELTRCVREAKRVRPEAKIAAGFGIRTGRDIERLSGVRGLDAVIVGTELLLNLEQGAPAVKRKLEEFEPALRLK